ncbi:adenine DNA glycosylase-like [Zingiber officinale]|uniref:adenine DNA glycosylase-like n=1 Tax=Zingiber officinale TaxID=94328 RepID=UPI001C4BCDAF|nr:adenine DNA glycosylase-like [Zingiber officinale]
MEARGRRRIKGEESSNAKKRNTRPRQAAKEPSTERDPQGQGEDLYTSPLPLPDIEDFSPDDARRIRASLLDWYDAHRRDLPWRRTKTSSRGTVNRSETESKVEAESAYAVWVSEVMLQQTRVSTVISYYNRWMDKWPTIHHLAAASQEEVNEMWAGLGYYRRARFLLEGAKSIVQGGMFPQTAAELLKVQGIGDYTAGAIASIAFNEAVPVVDGNVVRVISRLKAITANPKKSATVKGIWKLASLLVDPLRPGDFNQAMMELGATLCSTMNPQCCACPISDNCVAFSLSKSEESIEVTDYPTKVAKAKQRHDFAAVCFVQLTEETGEESLKRCSNKDMLLLVKRPNEGLLAGLWEFPSVLMDERVDIDSRRRSVDKFLRKLFHIKIWENCEVVLREDVGECIHVFSHIRLHMHIELLILKLNGGLNQFYESNQFSSSWKCVDAKSIRTMGLTSGVRKVYNMVEDFKRKKITTSIRRSKKEAQKFNLMD